MGNLINFRFLQHIKTADTGQVFRVTKSQYLSHITIQLLCCKVKFLLKDTEEIKGPGDIDNLVSRLWFSSLGELCDPLGGW